MACDSSYNNIQPLWPLFTQKGEVKMNICWWEQAFKWCDLYFAADDRMIDDDDDNDNDDYDDDGHQTTYACWLQIQTMVGSLIFQNKKIVFAIVKSKVIWGKSKA